MPPSTKNSRTSYLANRRQPPPARNPPKITLPTTPTITLPPTPSVKVTPTPKINLSKSSEPKLTLPTYSTGGGFTSNQRYQTQTNANNNNNNNSQEDNFLKKYPQVLLVIPLILIILSKK